MIRLKNDKEIEGIRKSCHLLADLFNNVIPRIKDGLTTADVDLMCHLFMTQHGGKPAWYKENFPGSICISVNNEVIHGVPSHRRVIHTGDLVSLDIGIDLNGFISDSTHSVVVGKTATQVIETGDSDIHRLHMATIEALNAGIAACVVGNRIKDIAKAVFAVAQKYGYGVVREYCGHGVGVGVHEDPEIPNTPDKCPNVRIQKGMVLAIEPMINMGAPDVTLDKNGWTVKTVDGKPSCHEEHTLAVYADHTEILTDLNYK